MASDFAEFARRQATPLPALESADISGITAVVTGSNTGIGYEVAKYLAENGASKVILACRNEVKGRAAALRLGSAVEYRHLDLASFSSVREFVRDFKSNGMPLHLLVNNAGMHSVRKQTTEDGLDLLMQVNHISPFLLTLLLLPIMEVSSLSRIIWVTSGGAAIAEFPQASETHPVSALCALQFKPEEEHNLYFTSKLLNVMCCAELARRTAVRVAAAHPGLVATELGKKDIRGENFQPVDLEGRWGIKPRSPAEGAKTVLMPATYDVSVLWEQEGEMPLFDHMERAEYPPKAKDQILRGKVWEDTVKLMSLGTDELEERFL
ncbi:NAD-P-binding protein [Desarmillaria tabescens]|uniref:NAD-P-binding protein n=1 Tax=Armillaria tabescens TaxID=1929756 RepID=A0AA39MSK6_ARMTA|nr:NAD-P-binding protein [Desarmillaria tabescens]KAK0444275.1 NAD-P-binding protein [Desarmillaria tabescens]